MAARQRNYFYGWEIDQDRFLQSLRSSSQLRDVSDYIKNEYDYNRFYTGRFQDDNFSNNDQLYRFILENFDTGPEYGEWFPTVYDDQVEFRLYHDGSMLWFATLISASSLDDARKIINDLPESFKQRVSQFQNLYGAKNSSLVFRWLR